MGGGNKGRGKRKKQCRKKSKDWRQAWKEPKLREKNENDEENLR